MIKKILRIIGYVSIIIGFISFFPNLNYILRTKTTTGKVIEILQRKSGVNYDSVAVGGVYPCKLKFSFTDNQSVLREGLSSIEQSPCWSDNFSYFKISDSIKIRYSPENKLSPEVDNFAVRFGFPLIYLLFGTGLAVFSGKLPVKKK